MAQQNSNLTRSNLKSATSVSTLDHESSPKNDASKVEVDRLDKNAKTKIEVLKLKTNMTISLCNLELNLMIEVAKQRRTSVSREDSNLDLDAIHIGLDLGSRHIGLSATMREALDNIKLLDVSVYDAFVYAYNGSLRAN